jgi:hypothetical protein
MIQQHCSRNSKDRIRWRYCWVNGGHSLTHIKGALGMEQDTQDWAAANEGQYGWIVLYKAVWWVKSPSFEWTPIIWKHAAFTSIRNKYKSLGNFRSESIGMWKIMMLCLPPSSFMTFILRCLYQYIYSVSWRLSLRNGSSCCIGPNDRWIMSPSHIIKTNKSFLIGKIWEIWRINL